MNPSTVDQAKEKIKQLKEALQLCEKIAMQAQWAQDFANYGVIQEGMDQILEVVGRVEQDFDKELTYINDQIEDYDFKLLQFELENQISV